MVWLRNMAVALSMYSKIPMPHVEWKKENMRFALCFFPLVGVAIGLLTWLWLLLSGWLGVGAVLRATGFVLIPVLVTGGIHLDGFLDTADALASWQTPERRREILQDPHAGALAIVACCAYFLAYFAIWTEADAGAAALLGMGFILSRALSGFGICTFPCAKETGLAAVFANGADRKKTRIVLCAEAAVCIAGMLALDVKRGAVQAAVAIVVCVLCRRMAMKRFGGITGDIQGFFLQMCELAMSYAVILL